MKRTAPMAPVICHPKSSTTTDNPMITMYYDDSCPICQTEAQHLKSDIINIVTIKDGLAQLQKHGIDEITAMTYLCVLDEHGKIHRGIHAVRLLHQKANTPFHHWLQFPLIKQISAIIYPLFAKYRHKIPYWLIIRLFGAPSDSDDHCRNGTCHLSPNARIKHHQKDNGT